MENRRIIDATLACGRILLGFAVALTVYFRLGLFAGLPAGGNALALLLLGVGYLLYSLTGSRVASDAFILVCLSSGAYLLVGGNWVFGVAVIACGILIYSAERPLSR